MSMAALFGKLREHELELGQLNEEEHQWKRKNLAFKFEVERCKSLEEYENLDDENLSHMIRKFNKFMKSKGNEQFINARKEKQGSSSKYRCYGCGENGHVNTYCPNIKKDEEKKIFKNIAWEDNDSSSSSSSDSDEEVKLCLMTNNESSESQVSVSVCNNDYENLHDVFQQLLHE